MTTQPAAAGDWTPARMFLLVTTIIHIPLAVGGTVTGLATRRPTLAPRSTTA